MFCKIANINIFKIKSTVENRKKPSIGGYFFIFSIFIQATWNGSLKQKKWKILKQLTRYKGIFWSLTEG